MINLLILLLFFLAVMFVFSALVAAVRFNLDLHRYKQTFNFAGRRKKFIDFLLEKELNGKDLAADQHPEQGSKEGDLNAS